MCLDNPLIESTKVFPAEELVQIKVYTEDPDRASDWKGDIRSDAAYEGAEYCGTMDDVDDDSFTVVVPRLDLRRWEHVSASNGADLVIHDKPLLGGFALPKLPYQ
jgi:hypothetical protein